MRRSAWVAVVMVVGASCGGGTVREPKKASPDAAADEAATPPSEAGTDLATNMGRGTAGHEGAQDAAADTASEDASVTIDTAQDTASAADVAGGDASVDAAAGEVGDAPVGDASDGSPPKMVVVAFTGHVATVSNAPFGFDGTARLAPVSGSFSYDQRLPDDLPADPKRGRYDRGRTAFTLTVKTHTVTGSGLAILQTENLDPDTFRFLDGPQPLDPTVRTMKLDGVDAPTLALFIAITDGAGAMLTSDVLPAPFPSLDFTSFQISDTFSLADGSNGTLLLQLESLTSQ